MARFISLAKKYKHGLILFVAFLIIILFVELFVFNRVFLFTRVLNLEERHYSINEGSLYQFNLVNGKLDAQNNDPNITFDHINLPVGAISIKCSSSSTGAVGQVFYRNNNESFTELHSVRYDESLNDKIFFLSQILEFPKVVTVSSLRFDLTNIPGDIVSCSEFIINPHIPFNLSRVRLTIYLGLLLLAILFALRNIKPRLFNKILFFSIFIALSSVLSVKLMPLAKSLNIVFIVVLSILLFSFAITHVLVYLFKGFAPLKEEGEGFLGEYKYEIALAIVLLITTLPLLTTSYFYYDDWWNIGNKALLTRQSFFAYGRPIQVLLFATLDKINIRDAYVFKWVFLFAIVLYAILLFRWLANKTQNKNFSFILAAILSLFAPVMDLLGYTATGAFTFSILFSSLSLVCFEQAYASYNRREIGKTICFLVFTFSLIFTACLTYQIGPQIVFLFFTIELFFGLKLNPILKKNFIYLLIFGLSNGFYLLFLKLINQLYNSEITTNRSQLIHSVPQIIEKFHFYETVITQSIMQVETALTGNVFILERYHGYFISFANHAATGNLIFYFVISMIIIAFVGYWYRTKSILGLIALLINIPLSYYSFLILSENGYLTYYAFAHISIIMFYFLMGFIFVIQFIWTKSKRVNYLTEPLVKTENNFNKILIPLLVLCALVSNNYIRDFYIKYNSQVYSFVKYNIQTYLESSDLKRIHVIGTISPLSADVYSSFVVETALKDLGVSPDNYTITYSKNKNYLARIEEVDYLNILQKLSKNDKLTLGNYYAFDPTYRQYNLKVNPSMQDQISLHRIFGSAGAIPQNTTSDTLIIDLTWTDTVYYNH